MHSLVVLAVVVQMQGSTEFTAVEVVALTSMVGVVLPLCYNARLPPLSGSVSKPCLLSFEFYKGHGLNGLFSLLLQGKVIENLMNQSMCLQCGSQLLLHVRDSVSEEVHSFLLLELLVLAQLCRRLGLSTKHCIFSKSFVQLVRINALVIDLLNLLIGWPGITTPWFLK